MAYWNSTAKWACAPLLVPKPGPARFRFTVDLRLFNKYTIKQKFPMPNLDIEISTVSTSRYFDVFDVNFCFWQFPLHADSEELQSFLMTIRVMHGTINAVT